MDELSDQQLISAYLNGDEKSFTILVRRYLALVFNFCNSLIGNREIAEEVAQEVFLKIWKSLKNFDKDKQFKTWFLTDSWAIKRFS